MGLFSELAIDDLPMGAVESLGHFDLIQPKGQKLCREV